MSLKNNKESNGAVNKTLLYVLALIMLFLLLIWAIWWSFDYKIQALKTHNVPEAGNGQHYNNIKNINTNYNSNYKNYTFTTPLILDNTINNT